MLELVAKYIIFCYWVLSLSCFVSLGVYCMHTHINIHLFQSKCKNRSKHIFQNSHLLYISLIYNAEEFQAKTFLLMPSSVCRLDIKMHPDCCVGLDTAKGRGNVSGQQRPILQMGVGQEALIDLSGCDLSCIIFTYV